jgi:hypothetical protein
MKKSNIILIALVSSIILAARLIPHAPNFSPLIAVMLFSGVYNSSKKYILLPLLALFISDMFIGFYKLEIMLAVYGSLLAITGVGYLLRKQKNIINVISGSLASALIFFIVTNWAVWFFGNWYTNDINGLALSFSMAIPFFKNTLVSTMLYSGLLFGVYEGAYYLSKQKKLITNK